MSHQIRVPNSFFVINLNHLEILHWFGKQKMLILVFIEKSLQIWVKLSIAVLYDNLSLYYWQNYITYQLFLVLPGIFCSQCVTSAHFLPSGFRFMHNNISIYCYYCISKVTQGAAIKFNLVLLFCKVILYNLRPTKNKG